MGITTVGWQCLLGSLGSFVALGSEEMRTEADGHGNAYPEDLFADFPGSQGEERNNQ